MCSPTKEGQGSTPALRAIHQYFKPKNPKTKRARLTQQNLREGLGIPLASETIEATGDKLIDKEDHIVRIAFQNINGLSLRENVTLMPEVAAMGALQLDIAAFTETNVHWTSPNRHKLQSQINYHLGSTRLATSSAFNSHDVNYQPGGTMLSTVGRQTGRVHRSGSDAWGRFSWMTFRGRRDEGIVVISAYRVPQTKGTDAGPTTAYMQQLKEMIAEGDQSMDPRQRVLNDLQDFITARRQEGYRPILLMDANDDWEAKSGKPFAKFLENAQLIDAFHAKIGKDGLRPTYARGSRRIDYMLMDEALLPSIDRIGTLGLHDEIVSDHVMLYADFDERSLFQGIINRPVMNPSREFILAQADKCETFTKTLRELVLQKRIPDRVQQLAQDFTNHGATAVLVRRYNNLDKEIQDCVLAVAKKVVKKKFGYQRSPILTEHGQRLRFWKAVKSARFRHTTISKKMVELATKLAIGAEEYENLSRKQSKVKVKEARQQLWAAQKEAVANRVKWLEQNAQDIARAAGDPDWKKKMEDMAQLAEKRAIHRQISAAMKGIKGGIDRIEVPEYEWYYARSTQEIYRYDSGVFECYSAYTPQPLLRPTHPTKFLKHHHLKVLPNDATPAEVWDDGTHFILSSVSLQCPIWKDVTEPEEIESLLQQRNKRHLQQASIEESRSHDPLLESIKQDYGTGDLLEDLLSGKIDLETCTDETIRAWVLAVAQTDAEKALPPITGAIDKEAFQAAFHKVAEKTSSSPSGLHYSIWKCLAKEDDFAEWLSIMMSLPFLHGFTNDRWLKSIDVMLEKKPGVRQIHLLRIIGLLEADFNTALKILFSQRLMMNAEKAGIHDEQWGGRANKTSVDAAFRKMMSFEYGRFMKVTIALFANDQTACFDRMHPSISNVISGKFGMDINVLRARSKVIHGLKRHVRTSLGVSPTSYRQHPEEALLQGEYQGKGDVASLWVLLSSTILQAHSSLYSGITLHSVTDDLTIKKNNDAYVDDTDTWAMDGEWGSLASQNAVVKLISGAQKLSNCNDVVGQATAFHKCAFQVLGFQQKKGSLVIDRESAFEFTLHDVKGATSPIKQLRPEDPNKGLGYYLTADGNQEQEYTQRKAKISAACRAAATIHLTQKSAKVMLLQHLTPQTWYGFQLSQFSPKQCKDLDVIVMNTFLPRLGIHRKMKRAIVYGPIKYGGLDLPSSESLQAQANLLYVLRTLRHDVIPANDLLVVLQSAQLVAGFSSSIWEEVHLSCPQLEMGWIRHIRNTLRNINGRMWVERLWCPPLQRTKDQSLMEMFAGIPNIKPRHLIQANSVRMWMRVITLSDLTALEGDYIPIDRLWGSWRADSSLLWPNMVEPSKEAWATFRRCLRQTCCTSATPWSKLFHYVLDNPLGMWLPAFRHIQYKSYISKDSIIIRNPDGLYVYKPTSSAGFFQLEHRDGSIDVDSYPIFVQQVDHRIWTRKKHRIKPTVAKRNHYKRNHFKVVTTLRHKSNTSTYAVVSDSSVRVSSGRASAGWIIEAQPPTDPHGAKIARKALDFSTARHSFRGELEGIYYALTDALSTIPPSPPVVINQYCDSESSIKKLEAPIHRPAVYLSSDMDAIMAIQQLVKTSDHSISFSHVHGHMDSATKNKKNRKLTHPEILNVGCDSHAEQCLDADESVDSFEPLEGSKAMLQIEDVWITSHIKQAIKVAYTEEPLLQYIKERHQLLDIQVSLIDWDLLGDVKSSLPDHKSIRVSKTLFNWLPVGHNHKHYGTAINACPCCGQRDETFPHLLRCPSRALTAVRQDSINTIRQAGIKRHIPSRLLNLYLQCLSNSPLDDMAEGRPQWETDIINSQCRVGRGLMRLGFLSTAWRQYLERNGDKRGLSILRWLQLQIWDNYHKSIWDVRNHALHRGSNAVRDAEKESAIEQLIWTREHRREVLNYRHHRLVEHDDCYFCSMSLASLRELLKIVIVAREAYITECNQVQKGQRTLDQFFHPPQETGGESES